MRSLQWPEGGLWGGSDPNWLLIVKIITAWLLSILPMSFKISVFSCGGSALHSEISQHESCNVRCFFLNLLITVPWKWTQQKYKRVQPLFPVGLIKNRLFTRYMTCFLSSDHACDSWNDDNYKPFLKLTMHVCRGSCIICKFNPIKNGC